MRTTVLAVAMCLMSGVTFAQAALDSSQVQEHIRQLILSLPSDSQTRVYLERGDRGDGLHYPWMDRMKSAHVKRVRVFLDFEWRRHPINVRVDRIAFYSSYDADCSQITDPAQVELIQKSGLAEELGKIASSRVTASHWTFIDKKPRSNQGLATVELMDDEWLPLFAPELTPVHPDLQKPEISVDGDFTHLRDSLRSSKFSQDDLDAALFETASSFDDSCSVKLLLAAGANPNSQNTDGETPLMQAAFAGHIHAVQALLSGGAHTNLKDSSGATAEDVAKQRGHQAVVLALEGNRPK